MRSRTQPYHVFLQAAIICAGMAIALGGSRMDLVLGCVLLGVGIGCPLWRMLK
jgi:hypothetical protein